MRAFRAVAAGPRADDTARVADPHAHMCDGARDDGGHGGAARLLELRWRRVDLRLHLLVGLEERLRQRHQCRHQQHSSGSGSSAPRRARAAQRSSAPRRARIARTPRALGEAARSPRRLCRLRRCCCRGADDDGGGAGGVCVKLVALHPRW